MNAACPRRVSLIIAGGLPAIPSPTIDATTGDRPAASGCGPPRQASPFARRLARPRRPNRVHGGSPHGKPALRTGRSRSGALHPALQRRSSGSIPHGSSPHRSGLSPLRLPAFSGARAHAPRVPFSASSPKTPSGAPRAVRGRRGVRRKGRKAGAPSATREGADAPWDPRGRCAVPSPEPLHETEMHRTRPVSSPRHCRGQAGRGWHSPGKMRRSPVRTLAAGSRSTRAP